MSRNPEHPSDVTTRITGDEATLRMADEGSEASSNAVLYVWFQLFKTALIHAIDNRALEKPIEAMATLTAEAIPREGRIALQARDGALFVNGLKLRLTAEEMDLAHDVFEFFELRGMGGWVVDGELDLAAVRRILEALVYVPVAERSFEAITVKLREAAVPFRITKPSKGPAKTAEELLAERRDNAFFSYAKVAVLLDSLVGVEPGNQGRRAFLLKKVARAVQGLVETCTVDPETFLLLASVRRPADYDGTHAANTAVLSIALGAHLGLSRSDLADLGMAALFHDVGLRSCPPAIRGKAGALEPTERAEVDRHCARGVEFLLGERRFNRAALTRIVVAHEHHVPFAKEGLRRPDPFTRIVTLTSTYDALTTDRPWRPGLPADQVFTILFQEAGRMFDPVLVRALLALLGALPVGTLVKLSSGEVAVVVAAGGVHLAAPVVVGIDREGRAGRRLDLGTGQVRIESVIDPAPLGLSPSGVAAAAVPKRDSAGPESA
jgi:HD-GYP domain-containing protein (c-di-GMP phosphodiesterase class II)